MEFKSFRPDKYDYSQPPWVRSLGLCLRAKVVNIVGIKDGKIVSPSEPGTKPWFTMEGVSKFDGAFISLLYDGESSWMDVNIDNLDIRRDQINLLDKELFDEAIKIYMEKTKQS